MKGKTKGTNPSEKNLAPARGWVAFDGTEKNSHQPKYRSHHKEEKKTGEEKAFLQGSGLSLPETEQALAEIWKEIFFLDQVRISDNFFELGGNVPLAHRTMPRINTALRRHLSLSTLFAYPTIETLAEAVVNKKIGKEKSLVPIKEGGNKTPLYIVSYVGGSIDRFCELSYLLDREQPVYGLQTPLDIEDFKKESFNAREVGLNYINIQTAQYISEVLEQNPDGPFALAGYSYGGFIALEMAKQLQKMGKKVVLLAMLDTLIPGVKKTLPRIPEGVSLKWFARIHHQKAVMLHYFRIKVYDNVFLLKHHRKEWLRIKMAWAKHFFFGAKTSVVKKEPDLAFRYLVTKRNELAAFAGKNYDLEFYDGEIVLFRAQKLSSHSVYDLTLGWKHRVKSIRLHKIDGDHISMFKPFYCKRFAQLLQGELDRCNSVAGASKKTTSSKA